MLLGHRCVSQCGQAEGTIPCTVGSVKVTTSQNRLSIVVVRQKINI